MKKLTGWIIGIVIIGAFLLFIFSAYRFDWEWTGFVTFTTDKSNKEEIHLGKALWDWLDLLIVPALLAGGAIWLNWQQKQREKKFAEAERENDRRIARDREEKQALREYFDAITKLLLEPNDLQKSNEDSEVRSIARARTLAILRSFDVQSDESKIRKGSVLQFLNETKLIDGEKPIIPLDTADLRRLDLRRSNLSGANLIGADLSEAKMFGTDLSGALLLGADLHKANLGKTDLREADLRGAILYMADLRKADLRRANLRGAVLRRADLREADLQGAILSGTNLSNVELLGIHLRGVNLFKTIRREADLSGAILDHAIYNTEPFEDIYGIEIGPTRWPPGFNPEDTLASIVNEDKTEFTFAL